MVNVTHTYSELIGAMKHIDRASFIYEHMKRIVKKDPRASFEIDGDFVVFTWVSKEHV